jgi:hypothetical protein
MERIATFAAFTGAATRDSSTVTVVAPGEGAATAADNRRGTVIKSCGWPHELSQVHERLAVTQPRCQRLRYPPTTEKMWLPS